MCVHCRTVSIKYAVLDILEEWEAELQKELNDYEVVSGSNELDDEALEKEIMQEIKDTSTA